MKPKHNILKEVFAGKTLTRILMNSNLSAETLKGRVVDIGGGRNPDYFEYFKKGSDVQIEPLDGSLSGIDFEIDILPYSDDSIDTVIACNVLEHVYNHKFLLNEMSRILKPKTGRIIGFVPFWVGYHPDPHDYFRYTSEALGRLLSESNFTDINISAIGGGPVIANYNTIVLSVPRIIRPLLYLLYAPLDRLFLFLRPQSAKRNPLGFIFSATKTTKYKIKTSCINGI